jgi:hypothetical protein
LSAVAEALDHVGVAGADLDALAAQWTRLGFTLTPFARHAGPREIGGPVVPYATGNRCVMLREGYVELIAVVDPAAPEQGLGALLARYAGIQILALAVDDAAANLARLRAAGLAIPGVAYLERPVDDAQPDAARARFARLPLPDAPEGRIQLIEHLTPEAIWQERFMGHANRAVALAEVTMAVAVPAETAARLSRLAGRPVVPDSGGFALELPRGRVRVLPPDLGPPGEGGAPCLPWIGGLTLRTDDGNAALRAHLAGTGVSFADESGGVVVGEGETGGVRLRFVG